MIFRLAFILIAAIFSSHLSVSQFAVLYGGNYNSIRHNELLENTKALISPQIGASLTLSLSPDTTSRFSLTVESLITRKGYKQDLDSTYSFNFGYIAIPVMINYNITNHVLINAGIEPSFMLFTNLRQGDLTYNDFDLGLIVGITLFDGKLLNVYSRFTYGLINMLDYYEIDRRGNFVGEIHDLKNTNISIGLKMNFNRKKIGL